eukprot:781224-Prorocentrum_minimum.AAC.1
MEHQMKCAAMVAALARADKVVYGDLVTNLTARSFSDINKISLAEIRSLATSAYNTAQQRRNFQSSHATSAIMGKKPAAARRGNIEKKKSNTTQNKDKVPRCRICQAANK